MPAIVTPGNFVRIALMSYAFIWLANRGLDKMGLGAFKA